MRLAAETELPYKASVSGGTERPPPHRDMDFEPPDRESRDALPPAEGSATTLPLITDDDSDQEGKRQKTESAVKTRSRSDMPPPKSIYKYTESSRDYGQGRQTGNGYQALMTSHAPATYAPPFPLPYLAPLPIPR